MKYLLTVLAVTGVMNLNVHAQESMMNIANDIIGLTSDYNMAWESLDMDSVATFHSEDFTYYWKGSLSVTSNKAFVEGYKKIMSNAAKWTMYIDNLQVQVLDENNVIIGFDISETELILKDGTELDYGIGAMTYFWHRRDGEWKLVHIHESAKEKDTEH
ncbi:MAG: nuclear transport factor 2 family protein [Saprospiraceae bacterium]|nr:nuclear transport factor 2 family protein [Saprospiraceae bacterium]